VALEHEVQSWEIAVAFAQHNSISELKFILSNMFVDLIYDDLKVVLSDED